MDQPVRRGACLLWAAAAAALTLLWWALTVHYTFKGNWTALYCTGEKWSVPAELASENVYQFAGSTGFDGQFYHYIAHDPLLQRGLWKHIDAARLRYRRILAPGVAYLLAGGQDRYIDAAYLGVVLGFIFLGAWWLSRWGDVRFGQPAWGLGFALAPAVLISIDRLTVDGVLAALCVGFVIYARGEGTWRLYAVLILAGLTRETGLLLALACSAAALVRREWLRAALLSAIMLPALAWYAYVQRHTPNWLGGTYEWVPFRGLARVILHPQQYPLAAPVAWVAHGLDYLALAGMLLCLYLAWRVLRERRLGAVEIAIGLFALVPILLGTVALWESVYSFGRTLTPLLLLVALSGRAAQSRAALLPLAMVTPRVLLQLGPQVVGIARGLLGW